MNAVPFPSKVSSGDDSHGSDLPPRAIICGTDFSEKAAAAVEVATAFSSKLGEPLILAHAVAGHFHEKLPEDLRESLCLFERAQLHEEIASAGAAGVIVREHFAIGHADAVLRDAAKIYHGRLLVLSSHGRRSSPKLFIGSMAEQTAETATIPALVVRHPVPLLNWLHGERRLRVFVGADFSPSSEAALCWVRWLRERGACDVTVAHFDPQPCVFNALEVVPPALLPGLYEKYGTVSASGFRKYVDHFLGDKPVKIKTEPGWSQSDAHLIHAAELARADLIVVGSHQRKGWRRAGHYSVSRGVLRYATMNVACIPSVSVPKHGPSDQG